MEPLSPFVDPMLVEHLEALLQRNGELAIERGWTFEAGPLPVDAAWSAAVLARAYEPEAMRARATGTHRGRGARTEVLEIGTRTITLRYVHPLREVTSVQSLLPIPDLYVGRLSTERRHGILASGGFGLSHTNEFLPPGWAARLRPQRIGLRGIVQAEPSVMPPRAFAEWLVDLAAPFDEVVVRGGFVHVLARTILPAPPVDEALDVASTIADALEQAVSPRP